MFSACEFSEVVCVTAIFAANPKHVKISPACEGSVAVACTHVMDLTLRQTTCLSPQGPGAFFGINSQGQLISLGWAMLPTLQHISWQAQWQVYLEHLRKKLDAPALSLGVFKKAVSRFQKARLQHRKGGFDYGFSLSYMMGCSVKIRVGNCCPASYICIVGSKRMHNFACCVK